MLEIIYVQCFIFTRDLNLGCYIALVKEVNLVSSQHKNVLNLWVHIFPMLRGSFQPSCNFLWSHFLAERLNRTQNPISWEVLIAATVKPCRFGSSTDLLLLLSEDVLGGKLWRKHGVWGAETAPTSQKGCHQKDKERAGPCTATDRVFMTPALE